MSPLTLLLACAPTLRPVPPDARVDLPADHGPHADAQTEWWHVHGQVEDVATGETLDWFVGFVVQRTTEDRVAGIPVRWVVDTFHTAYAQVVTAEGRWTADRQAFPDLWAAGLSGEGLDLRHDDWRLAVEAGVVVLALDAGPHRLDLRLVPTEPALTPGRDGRVALPPGSAHLWVQQERLRVEGRWQQGRRTRWVQGQGFYKHQWGRLYDPQVDGFTWISLDLDEAHSLSLGWIEHGGIQGAAGSLAWLGHRDGTVEPLAPDDLRLAETRTWRSRRSGAEWPVAWRLEGAGLDLALEALAEDQELYAMPAALHLGPGWAWGTFRGQPVDGPAYLEQAGAHAPRLRHLFTSRAPGGGS